MRPLDADIVAALYGGIVDEAKLESAIAALARRFACHSASIVSFDPTTPSASIAVGAGTFDAEAKRRYEADFAVHDPAPAVLARLPSGSAYASDRLFPAESRRKSVMLQEFLRPLGIEETLGGTVSSADGRFGFLTVHRGTDRQSFDDTEIVAMEQVVPHVARALQLRHAFAQMQTNAALLAAMIDRLPAGIVVIDAGGAVVHVNHAAREIAARGDGLWLDRAGIPHATNRTAERELARCRTDAMAGKAGGIVRFPRRPAVLHYAALIAPLPDSAAFDLDSGRGRAGGTLVLIHDPDAKSATPPESIAAIFDLPPATARLLAALVEGEEPKDYAERNGVTYDAVRHHLKTAFSRTGIRTTSRLMQLVARALGEIEGRR